MTDYTTAIKVGGALMPDTQDTPLDLRTRVTSLSEIPDISSPYKGMLFYVQDNDTYYKVTTLQTVTTGLSTKNIIGSYEEFLPSNELLSADSPGFFVTDSSLNIGMQYTEDGFDVASVSEHFKTLIDTDTNSFTVDSTGESVIGKYKYLLSDVVTYLPLYEQTVAISTSSITAGTDITQVFSFLDYIDYQKYVIVHNITVRSNSDEVVYNNPFTKAKVTNTAGGLQFVLTPTETIATAVTIEITLRYVKNDDGADYVGLEFSITDSSIADVDALGLSIAPLKFDKEIAVGIQMDDMYADGYSRIFAHFNGRGMGSNGGVCCHQFQWLAGYRDTNLPSSSSRTIPLFTDGCGVDKRFKMGAVFWPQIFPNYSGATVPYCLFTSSLTDNQGAYVSHWTNYGEMVLYLNDLGNHNVFHNAEYPSGRSVTYNGLTVTIPYCDETNYASLQAGFNMDIQICKHLFDYNLRMHIVPDGNDSYGHAARLNSKLSFYTTAQLANVSQYLEQASYAYKGVMAYSKYMTGYEYEVGKNYCVVDVPAYNAATSEQYSNATIGRDWFSFGSYLSDITTELAITGKENRKAMFVGTHEYTDTHADAFDTISNTYGKNGNDTVWCACETEYFDYYRIAKYSKIRVYKSGDTFKVKVYMPTKDANGNTLEFLETTIKANLTANSVVSFTDSASDQRLINITSSVTKGIVNVYADSRVLTTIDTLISRIQATSVSYVRTTYLADLTYFVSQLKPSLQTYYNNIINTL